MAYYHCYFVSAFPRASMQGMGVRMEQRLEHPWGYSHVWATRVCAAQQGMLFASLSDSGTGYKNNPFSLEEGIFYFRFDAGTG